jgi:L-alanine-DL-glutamate epimerase-like enolase superfamily enzyme
VTQTIAKIDARLLEVPLDPAMRAHGSSVVNIVFVTITDNDGRTGTGFTYTLNLGASVVRTMIVDVLAPLMVGTEMAAWASSVAAARKQTRRLGPAVFTPAFSALDIAAWDLRAVEADLPLYAFLGRTKTSAPFYGSGRSSNTLSVDNLVTSSLSYIEMGLPAIKLRIGARSPAEDVERVRRVREAVGDDIALMVDANEQLTRDQAFALLPGLERHHIAWIEEPYPAEDVPGHAELARATDIPVAAGEHLAGEHQFAEYLRAGAAGLWQPDPALSGGVTTALEVAALGAAHEIPIAYHSLPELNVHLTMGDGNVTYVEHFPILDPILATVLTAVDGTVTAPDAPGHGMDWDHDAIAFHTMAGE